MSGRRSWVVAVLLALSFFARMAEGQQRREREPNSVYAERRVKLALQVDAPIVLWGFTGREEISQDYVFAQEENFYYLTGHNEEGAGLILLPAAQGDQRTAGGTSWNGPREMLFLPAKDPGKEKWNGVRMSPSDPGIEAHTGFTSVKPFPEMRSTVENLAKLYPAFYTILPFDKELGGYPHEKAVVDWLQLAAPKAALKDVRAEIAAMRPVKSSGEIAFLKQAIDLTVDSHLEAMKMIRPGLYEYQVAAKMVEVHASGGSEREGYAPIVGAGPNSIALHYDQLARKIEDGDIVVLDVGAQYSGYSADITRTIPANGKFTARQREIYEIVLGAQNAALAAIKPGAHFYCKGKKDGLMNIAYDYINSHGKDREGRPLGQYFIHGLGHHIGLNVHDPGDYCSPLQPGMVVTVEPGIYIPEEKLGVRIEDDLLITESGYKLLSERLPRNPDEIERIMTEGAKESVHRGGSPSGINSNSSNSERATEEIKSLIAKYTKSVDDADTNLASQVWWDSPEASFIHPLGHEHGFEQIKENVYKKLMGGMFSERKLSAHDLAVVVLGDAVVATFYWDFVAKFRKDASSITTHGRETQVYYKMPDGW
ncbi:MAG TPA: aminopeptidase P N-terminal domain-containing protein, partial [Candidatus Dormibacteraeota bacterium]|nr:aminopeptidase P N-terminal domain-containing protein [Candidatus Dormibacteraeota bacterium]